MVFENRILRKIFGRKRDKVTGERRKIHNMEIHNLYYSPKNIREDELSGRCSTHGGDQKRVKKL
jgi:hypothetical protein